MGENTIWADIWADIWEDIWGDAATAMALLATISFGPTVNGTPSFSHMVSSSDPTVGAALDTTIDIEPEE